MKGRAFVLVSAVIASATFAGCAHLKNTPEQDYVWEKGRICDAGSPFWKLERVDADGSYLIRGATNAPPGRQEYFTCMQEQFAREPYGRWFAQQSRASAAGRPDLGKHSASSGGRADIVLVAVQIIDNLVLVPAMLNRAHGATLLLDTGSQYTILTPDAAKRVGLVVSSDTPLKRLYVVGGQRVEVPFLRLRVIEIGGAALENVEVGVYPVAPQAPAIDGFLGANILDRFSVSVDSAAKQLRLEPKR